MGWSLASTLAKLKRCQQMPMPGTATTNVEMTCLQGLADLERLEGPWLDGLATGDPEVAATTVRLLLAHLTWNSKRLLVTLSAPCSWPFRVLSRRWKPPG